MGADSITSGPKFRRRAAARPDEVLDAALGLFAARGFAQVKVEEVAKAAGLSKAAVYLYFPSKKALLAGLVRRAVAPVAALALGPVEGPALGVIAGLLRAAAVRLDEPGMAAVPAIVLREAAAVPEIVQVYREEVLDRVLPALRQIIAGGIESGEIRVMDPDLAIRSIIGPVLAHMVLAQGFGVVPEAGLRLQALVDQHLGILEAGLRP